MARYRKKPVEIEAYRWTGGPDQMDDPVWILDAIRAGVVWFKEDGGGTVRMWIQTLEGPICASMGDWIIKGVADEIYPCKPAIFEATYEEVL